MISIQRDRQNLFIFACLSHQDSPRVSYISAEDFRANNQNWDTSWPTESEIDLWIPEQSLLDLDETFVQLFFDFCGIDDSLCLLSQVESRFDTWLYILTESRLYKVRDFFAKHSMAITNREKVGSSILSKMRQH